MNTDLFKEEAPILSLCIDYNSLPEAREAGRILNTLGICYRQTRLPTAGKSQLLVSHLQISSLVVWLRDAIELAEGVVTLIEQRRILLDFVEFLAVAINTARDGASGELTPAVRNFLNAFTLPVAEGRAASAKLNVQGDNNTIIYIEQADASALQMLLQQPQLIRPSAAIRLQRPSKKDLAEAVAAKREEIPAIEPPADEGVIFQVRGKWYAEPERFDGMLVPVNFDAIDRQPKPLHQRQGFRVTGEIRYRRNVPTAFHVQRVGDPVELD